MPALSSQFDFYREPDEGFKAGEGRGYGPTQFVAGDHDDQPVGMLRYLPAKEGTLVGNARYPRSGEVQGQMFRQSPAELDMLAVDPRHHGQGIASRLIDMGVAEHQARFGQNSVPRISESLSADSSAMANKLTGRRHGQTWGTGVAAPEVDEWGDSVKPEHEWARAKLAEHHGAPEALREEADWHAQNPGDEDGPARPVRQYPTGDLSRDIGLYTGTVPPEAPRDAPDQSTWGPKGTGEGKQLSFLKGTKSNAPQVKGKYTR